MAEIPSVKESQLPPSPPGPTLYSADPGGDEVINNGRMKVVFLNPTGSDKQVTVQGGRTCNFGFTHDDTPITVPGGQIVSLQTYHPRRFNNSQGRLQWTYDDATGLQLFVIEIEQKYKG